MCWLLNASLPDRLIYTLIHVSAAPYATPLFPYYSHPGESPTRPQRCLPQSTQPSGLQPGLPSAAPGRKDPRKHQVPLGVIFNFMRHQDLQCNARKTTLLLFGLVLSCHKLSHRKAQGAVSIRTVHAVKQDPCMWVAGSCPCSPCIGWAMGKLPLASLQGKKLPGRFRLRFPLLNMVGFSLFTSFRPLPRAQPTAKLK